MNNKIIGISFEEWYSEQNIKKLSVPNQQKYDEEIKEQVVKELIHLK